MKTNESIYNLKNDGFCFLPKIFSNLDIQKSRQGLWNVINGKYESGRQPENRFWDPGDDPHSIIKIDKPHICNQSVWDLITNKTFGKLLAKLQKRILFKYGTHKLYGNHKAKMKKEMLGGIEMLNTGHFGHEKVCIQLGLHYRMLLLDLVRLDLYVDLIIGMILKEWIFLIKILCHKKKH